MSVAVRNHAVGFEWGPINVVRLASNDGSDRRRIWYAMDIRTPSGSYMLVFDRKGRIIPEGSCLVPKEAPQEQQSIAAPGLSHSKEEVGG